MADDEPIWRCGRTHHTSAAQPFSALKRGFDILNANIEDRVAGIAFAPANAPADARSVIRGEELDKSVADRIGYLFLYGRRHVEGPAEQITVVTTQLIRILADHLKVHHGASHH